MRVRRRRRPGRERRSDAAARIVPHRFDPVARGNAAARCLQHAQRRARRPGPEARSVGKLEPQGVRVQRGARHKRAQAGRHRVCQGRAAVRSPQRRQLLRQRRRRVVGRQQRLARQVPAGVRGHGALHDQQRVRVFRPARHRQRVRAGPSLRRFRPDPGHLGPGRRGLPGLAAVRAVDRARLDRAAAGPFGVSRIGHQRRPGTVGHHRAADHQHTRQPAGRQSAARRHRARQVFLLARCLPATPPQPRVRG